MTTPSAHSAVPLFLGDDLDDDGERRLVARLREDLHRRGRSATLYANVIAGKLGNQRQVDLIVRSPSRVVVCEIKTWDQRLPVVGPINGPWKQLVDDRRPLLRTNAAEQANDATLAVSDSMRALAGTGRVADTPSGKPFYRYIDTVVCMFERIPEDSRFERRDHVVVLDYAGLVELICSERRRESLGWTDDDWARWVRKLGLYQQGSQTEEAIALAVSFPEVGEARARYVRIVSPVMPQRVPTAVRAPSGELVSFEHLHDELNTGGHLVLRGRSGSGKSLLASHLAVGLTRAGRLVVVVRSGDYDGQLATLIAHSLAPYSTEDHQALLAAATEAGVGITLVLDEFDRCPPGLTQTLSDQLSAFQLRTGSSVLVTTTAPTPPSMSHSRAYELLAPSAEERLAILVSHGAQAPERLQELFDTPFELTIAAEAEAELNDDASHAELFDAYLRKLLPTELQRSRLRHIARVLHQRLVASLPVLEVTSMLSRLGASAEEIDELLSCKLLAMDGSRVRFGHELLQRFLTAEYAVRELATGEAIGAFLSAPPNRGLASSAIGLVEDGDERWAAIVPLADDEVFRNALVGRLGRATQRRTRAQLAEVLASAKAITEHARMRTVATANVTFTGWELPRELDDIESSLIHAAGALLGETGESDPAILSLVDAADQLCRRVCEDLDRTDLRGGLDEALRAAFVVTSSEGRLPTQLLFEGARTAVWRRGETPTSAIVSMLLEGTNAGSWGRYMLAAEVANPNDPADAAALPALIERGWAAGAYHVRLEVLQAARRFAATDEATRTRLAEALENLDAEGLHMFLGSSLVEALAAFGRIDPISSLEDLQEQISSILAHSDDPRAAELAASMVDSQFEDETIVGPYYEAIASLAAEERVPFLCLAAGATQQRMWASWTLHRLADLAEELPVHRPTIRAAVEPHVDTPDPNAFMSFEAVAGWDAAVRAWAWCSDELPVGWNEPSVWAELGRTLWLAHRQQEWVEPQHRLVEFGAVALQALMDLHQAQMHGRENRPALVTIEDARRDEIREVLRWAIQHPEGLDRHRGRDLLRFAINSMGRVGSADDAELLREWTMDPELGEAATAAIVAISRAR